MPIEDKIEQNIPLKQFTTFKIGGPAKYFIEADNSDEIIDAIKWAKVNNQKFFILAGGSNLLMSDKGFNGLIIKNSSQQIFREKNPEGVIIKCGSGLLMSRAVASSSRHSLTGLEWAAGLPGTVGGAVRSNAGCFGSEMSAVVTSVQVYDTENDMILTFSKDDCRFGYHYSHFQSNNMVILECQLKLTHGYGAVIKHRIEEVVKSRLEKQPLRYPSAGSVFRNVPLSLVDNQELLDEAKEENKITGAGPAGLAAGWLIERLYFKGKQIGGAMVSLEHANFIVNKNGNATADDVLVLISLIKQKVRVEFGIQLREEVQYIDY